MHLGELDNPVDLGEKIVNQLRNVHSKEKNVFVEASFMIGKNGQVSLTVGKVTSGFTEEAQAISASPNFHDYTKEK